MSDNQGDDVRAEGGHAHIHTSEAELVPTSVKKYTERYDGRGCSCARSRASATRCTEQQRELRASVPRLIRPKIGTGTSERWNIMQPGDEPFRSQSLHVHFVTLEPVSATKATATRTRRSFIFSKAAADTRCTMASATTGRSATRSRCTTIACTGTTASSPSCGTVALVMKAKPTWLFLGLWQQGQIGTGPDPHDRHWGPRTEWAVARAPEDVATPKVLKPTDTPWEWTPHGHVRQLAGDGVPLRIKATDAYLQDIPAGSRSGKRWQMGDQVIYVIEGEGYDLHWDVEVEIADQYYAHIEREPTRWEWQAGNVIWVPRTPCSSTSTRIRTSR